MLMTLCLFWPSKKVTSFPSEDSILIDLPIKSITEHEFLEINEGESFCFTHFMWETIEKKNDE